MTRTRATATGFSAVLLWSLLALFTVGTAPTPPLLLNAICFTIGGALGLIVYTLVGAAATVVMQSSHATMVLVITALAAGQAST